jgi:nucleoside-diphosphate-sugar epimerase
MMHILITGGAGFLGVRLARTLLAQGSLALNGNAAQNIQTITLADRVAAPADLLADTKIVSLVGDLNDLLSQHKLPSANTSVVFHLAAAVSGECEADFDLGMRSNYEATRSLLEACRALTTKPTFVFASSLAVFGKVPGFPMPDLIEDDTLPTPQSSYGTQKLIGENLVADFGRKGFITARSVRLMTVSVRAGKPNGAASGFLSGMIREPLSGLKAACPVPADTLIALSSPARTVEGIIRAAEVSSEAWGPLKAVNLPALCTSVGDMVAALERVAGKAATDLLDWTPDPDIFKLVETWPGVVASARANKLGLQADTDYEKIIREYVRENPDAIKLKINA